MNWLYSTMQFGPLALLGAVIAVPVYYAIYSRAPQPKPQASLMRYLLTCFAVGVVAFVLGAMVGIFGACSPADAGNLCGLAGVLGLVRYCQQSVYFRMLTSGPEIVVEQPNNSFKR